jgi:hypothetical protein
MSNVNYGKTIKNKMVSNEAKMDYTKAEIHQVMANRYDISTSIVDEVEELVDKALDFKRYEQKTTIDIKKILFSFIIFGAICSLCLL